MNHFAITLVICSTFMHAGWNLLARRHRSEWAFFKKMLAIIAVVGFIPAVVSEILTNSLTIKAWLCVVGSGFFCGFYFFYLARAYESADFTVVYPIARALPVFLVGIGDVFRGRYPSAFGWVGMILIIFGCFLAQLYSLRNINIRSYFNRTSLWMVLTALGTVGYTLLDKVASEVIKQGPATAARYGYIFFLISYGVYTALLRKFKVKNQVSNLSSWWYPFFGALLTFGAYWLVLWAYQLSQHASYIVAFRQFSIVIGVIFAFVIYKEQGKTVRLMAVLIITTGLIFISLWG